MHSRGVVVILQAEGEVVVVLVGVGALGDLGQVVLEVRGPRRRCGGRVRGQVRVVVRIVRLQRDKDFHFASTTYGLKPLNRAEVMTLSNQI